MGRRRTRVHDLDQLKYAPRLWQMQWANQILAQILEIRETRIAALRKEIESGYYNVDADQVAEKIMNLSHYHPCHAIVPAIFLGESDGWHV